MTRSDQALNYLIHAIEIDGAEFPDACSRAARMFRVSESKLTAAYDEYCARNIT
jgi:hypothetical protein